MKHALKLLRTIVQLPCRSITLDAAHDEGQRMHQSFTSRHPRIPVFQKKTLGVALIDLAKYDGYEAYLKGVSGKNSAAYFSRKSIRSGYSIQEFDPNQLQSQLLSIHASQEMRQGKSMDPSYAQAIQYPRNAYNRYLGVFLSEKLCGYVWTIRSGELLVINRIMGHKEHLDQGIMYGLVLRAVELAFQETGLRYVMYDTLLMASDGLKLFKKRMGFTPYRVRWKLSLN